eukprot:c619_g1_i1 orf=306-1646(+)
MEPSSAPASSPRVYVPINHPDSPVPTYAVLQLVGFSDPSLQNPDLSHAITSARTSPFLSSANWGSGAQGDIGNLDTRAGKPLSGGLMETLKGDAAGIIGISEGEGMHTDVQLSTQENHSPENSSAGNPSPQGSSTGKSFCVDNPSPRGSCIDSSTCGSKGFDKRAVSIKPSPMKKSGIAGPSVVSVGAKKCSKVGSTGGPISISVSHTERETIVHAHSSNFREVVHQLTGASGDDGELLPVTVPSRASANRGNGDDVNGCLSKHEPVMKCEYTGRLPDLGLRKPMPTKLFERRRSSKTLERLSTSCRDLPPLVPSPVTPLASDFERICLPATPTASPVSTTVVPGQEHSIAQLHHTSTLRPNGNVQVYSSYNQPGMYLNQSQSSTGNLFSGVSELHHMAAHPACSRQEASVEDCVIAEKGFFLHPQRPRNSEPALLPLFPESPRGQ